MESIFEFLFKYRLALFGQGELVLRAAWPIATLLVAAAAVAAIVGFSYLRPRGRAGALDRSIMAVLRTSALGVIVLCLLQPTLVLRAVVPQRNFVGILVDDSHSMTLPGEDGRPREAFIADQLTPDGALMKALTDRFAVRTFAFSSAAGRVDDPTALGFDGTRTDLASALDRVREDLSSVPLSGIIVVSDGADNGGRVMAESLVPLQATSIPVFTVGLGEEVLSPDVQLDRVQAPRSVLLGSAVVVDVVVSQRGFAGQPVVLEVEDDGRILTRQDVPLGRNGEPVVARVRLIADRVGPRRLIFRIPVAERERVTGNNQRALLMDVQDTRQKDSLLRGRTPLRGEVHAAGDRGR